MSSFQRPIFSDFSLISALSRQLDESADGTMESDFLLLSYTSASLASDTRIRLTDKRTGLSLSSPLAGADIMWDAVHRPDSSELVKVMRTERAGKDAMEFSFLTGRSRIEWRMRIELDGSELRVRVPWESIREGRQSQFRLLGIRPLPGLLTGGGTFLAPLKCGALIRPARHRRRLSDRVLIYGDQTRHEDLPLLPLCGFYEEGRCGVALIAGAGDCDALYELDLPGDGTASCGFSFRYRYAWPDPVDGIDREALYVFLDAEDADYSGIGRRYHRFLREERGVETLVEKTARNPLLKEMGRSLVVKTFHAMKDLDRERGDGVFHLHQTFAETEQQLAKLKASGIGRAAVQLVGWNLDGHDGAYPRRFPVDARPGGEEGMRRLIRAGQRLGYQMQVHDNFADSTDPVHHGVIRRLWGDPLARGIWGGGAIYSLNPQKIGEAEIRGEMERVKALGVEGLYYLDAIAPPLEIDYDPACRVPRRAHADGLAWLLELGRSVFGACGAEMGFAHLARHADYISNSPLRGIPASSSEADAGIHSLVDEWVPVWQIAFHGLLIHSLVDRPVPALDKLLEAAETGAVPRCDFTGANPGEGTLLAVQWHDGLLPAYKAKFDILADRMGDVRAAPIVRHRSIGDRIFETEFSSGRVIQTDYGEGRIFDGGGEVPIPPVFDLDLPVRTA